MKMYFRLFAALALIVLTCEAAYCITTAELFSKAKQSLMLKEQQGIKDIEKIETLENSSSRGSTEMTSYTKGLKSRIEIKMAANGKETTVFTIKDGKDTWQIVNGMKMHLGTAKNAKETEKKLQEQLDKYNDNNSKIIKTESLNGRECYVVESAIKEKDTVKGKTLMWIDKENMLLYQILTYNTAGKELMKTIMSDYRIVFDKIQMPFLTEMYAEGKLAGKTTVKSIKINQGISDDLFDASKYKEINITQMMQGRNNESQPGAENGSNATGNEAPAQGNPNGDLKNSLKNKFMPFSH